LTPTRTLAAVSVAALVAACTSPGPMGGAAASADGAHDAHHPGAVTAMSSMEPRMKAMQDMHLKMVDAKTPAEREALMAEHMKAMQGGMAMLKEMRGMGAMGSKGMPAGMGERDQMMADHMAAMQMMMNMMVDRMPPATVAR